MDKKMLKELNFNNLLKFNKYKENYTFEDYVKHDNKHPELSKICTLCDDEKVNICKNSKNNKKFKLKTMGHGSMTDDILLAAGYKDEDFTGWKEDDVVFLLENPGPCDPNIYTEFEYNSHKKFPTHQWYFVNHPNRQKYEYSKNPKSFHGKQYGEFFTSVVFTFKLKNMYITDFIKCGMNDDGENNFKHISDYKPECIKNCLEKYFYKEIQLVKPKIIFCLGAVSYNKIKNKYFSEIKKRLEVDKLIVKKLPHPRAHKLSSIQFQYIYYKIIFDGLCESGIISDEDEKKYYEKRGNIKIDEIKQFLNEDGFTMRKQHNNFKSKNK